MWLTGMKKLIFYVNDFFGSGYFFDPWYLKNDQKIPGTKNFFVSKNQFCHARQPCKGFFEICIVFSHFSARASNGPQYSNFGNKCPKLGPGTLEDMLFTNLGETLDSVPSEIVLIYTGCSVFWQRRNYLIWTTKSAPVLDNFWFLKNFHQFRHLCEEIFGKFSKMKKTFLMCQLSRFHLSRFHFWLGICLI